MVATRIAAVTGGNKGIGLAIVRNLALSYPTSPLNTGAPLLIYLTARSLARGEQALAALDADPQLRAAGALRQHGGATTIELQHLDVADTASSDRFVTVLKKRHPEGVDVLVNNAGVALTGLVHTTLLTNYHAPLHLTTALLPHIRPGGRIVTLGSLVGKLNKYSPALTAAFRAARELEDITKLMDAFSKAVEAGKCGEEGWPTSAYAVSKSGIMGAMMLLGKRALLAREVEEGTRGPPVLVNVCCPGYVRTDMTKGAGRRTPDQGARTPVMLALGDLKGVGGEFWEHGEVSSW